MKLLKALMPLGMVGAAAYLLHAFLGRILWPAYNPLVTDLSTLTGDSAPNACLLRALIIVYGVCLILFSLGVVIRGWSAYHAATRTGYALFLVMAAVSTVGYAAFPLIGDKKIMVFQNRMHLAITVLVMLASVLALYLLAYGYFRKEKCGLPGGLSLIEALIMTVFGALNPIVMYLDLPIMGLVERITVYSLQAYVFALSYLHTFRPERMGWKRERPWRA